MDADGNFIDDELDPPKALDINGAAAGLWDVNVTGMASGTYILNMAAVGPGGNSSNMRFADLPISAGEVHSYAFNYDPNTAGTPSSTFQLAGGFDGGGQSSSTQTFREVAASLSTTCAIATDGRTFCWGTSDEGQLGAGSAVDSSTTPRLVPQPRDFTAVVATPKSVCALDAQQKAWCWGDNAFGELGAGNASNALPHSEAAVIVAGGHRFRSERDAAQDRDDTPVALLASATAQSRSSSRPARRPAIVGLTRTSGVSPGP
jgi:hypothetical protein